MLLRVSYIVNVDGFTFEYFTNKNIRFLCIQCSICCVDMSNEDIEFVYNTRSRRKNDDNFRRRVSDILITNIQTEPTDYESGDEEDPLVDINDTRDLDFVPDDDDASDIEAEYEVEPNEISDSENDEEETPDQAQSDNECFVGKDGTKWKKNEPSAVGRIRQHNITRGFRGGPKERNSVPIEVFKKFFFPTHEIHHHFRNKSSWGNRNWKME